MGNVSDLHFGSKASAEKKKQKQLMPENVFFALAINCAMGVLPLAQTVLSTHVR